MNSVKSKRQIITSENNIRPSFLPKKLPQKSLTPRHLNKMLASSQCTQNGKLTKSEKLAFTKSHNKIALLKEELKPQKSALSKRLKISNTQTTKESNKFNDTYFSPRAVKQINVMNQEDIFHIDIKQKCYNLIKKRQTYENNKKQFFDSIKINQQSQAHHHQYKYENLLKPPSLNTFQHSLMNNRKNSQNIKKMPSFLIHSQGFRKSTDLSDNKNHKNISIKDFEILKQMGRGQFGKVMLVQEKMTKMICVLKVVSKKDIIQSNMISQFIRQLKIQTYLTNPNIIKVYGFFSDFINFYIIMQCALDGQLHHNASIHDKIITFKQQKDISIIFYQICCAILSLHKNSIIHRDIKLQNILLHQGVIKLCDFGWSVIKKDEMRSTLCGTPLYLSPELMRGEQYDQKIDIWALGIILYELYYNFNPFKITSKQQMVNILTEEIYFDESIKINNNAKKIIMRCLNKNGEERPTIKQIMLQEFVYKGKIEHQSLS